VRGEDRDAMEIFEKYNEHTRNHELEGLSFEIPEDLKVCFFIFFSAPFPALSDQHLLSLSLSFLETGPLVPKDHSDHPLFDCASYCWTLLCAVTCGQRGLLVFSKPGVCFVSCFCFLFFLL